MSITLGQVAATFSKWGNLNLTMDDFDFDPNVGCLNWIGPRTGRTYAIGLRDGLVDVDVFGDNVPEWMESFVIGEPVPMEERLGKGGFGDEMAVES